MKAYGIRGAGALLIAGLAAVTGCDPSSQAHADGGEQDYVRVVNVEVEPVARGEFVDRVRLAGELEAVNDVTVSAEEDGVLGRYEVAKGSRVERGRLIVRIGDRVLRAQVAEAEADARLAAERFERQRRLWEEEEIGSEMTFLESKYQAELAQARMEALRARLARTRIEAPIAGVLDERFVETGERVAAGAPVVRIVQVDRLKATGGVPERYASSVSVGDTARITFDLFPGREFTGLLTYVGTAVNPDSRTFPVEFEIENPERMLKPHMLATVELATARLRDVLVIPQGAVSRTEEGYEAFVVEEDEAGLVARRRILRLGPGSTERVVVREGLEAGERLIVNGQKMVDPGDRVRLVGGNDR